jgi:hypothetical protein
VRLGRALGQPAGHVGVGDEVGCARRHVQADVDHLDVPARAGPARAGGPGFSAAKVTVPAPAAPGPRRPVQAVEPARQVDGEHGGGRDVGGDHVPWKPVP